MKKFICLLISFIVLISCFVVPSAAASEDVSNLVVVRGLMSRNTNSKPYGEWFECSRTPFNGSSFEDYPLTIYDISQTGSSNPVGDYAVFISFYNRDNSSISTSKHDLRIELNSLVDIFQMGFDASDPDSVFTFDGSKASRVSVIVKDLEGNSYSVDNFKVSSKVNSDGSWKLSLDIPCQDIDIYNAYIRFYFNIYDITDNLYSTSSVWAYGFYANGSAVIDLEPKDNSGLLNSILEWLEGIWNGITGLPQLIADKLSAFFTAIGNAIDNMKSAISNVIDNMKTAVVNALADLGNFIIDGFKYLFIPGEDFFYNTFMTYYNALREQLGILILPVDLISGLVGAYINLPNSDGVITFSSLNLFGVEFIKGGNFDLRYVLSSWLSPLQSKLGFNIWDIYYLFSDTIIILGFINYVRKKYNSIFGGT